jgi:major capsid protein E
VPTTLTYPSAVELMEIEQDKLPVLIEDDPAFEHFPIVTKDSNRLDWEQKDNYIGLQQVRGLNGNPGKVTRVGGNRYSMEPGVYGDFQDIDEKELTERRQWGSFNQFVSISDLVTDAQDQLLHREISRLRQVIWTLLTTGTFSVLSPTGALLHTDTFNIQTASAAVDWDTVATATPMADFRAVQLLARGHSVRFDRAATAYMNQVTANKMFKVTNAADLGGRLTNGGNNFTTIEDINKFLIAADLPQIKVHDDGYHNDSGSFTQFIADDKVVVIGGRTNGQPLGEYRKTRNANNPDLGPGSYLKIVDNGDESVPRAIKVHKGHNGGPVIFFPSGVVVLSV